MKRVIKFRAYTEISNEVLGMKYDVPHTYNDTVMQFTGLFDRNGKEIYEGDIIIIKRDISEVTGHDGISTIVWEDGAFYAQGDNHCNLAGKYLEYSEIIGNIYEKNN